MDLESLKKAWNSRSFAGPSGPAGEIARFDDLLGLATVQSLTGGPQLDPTVGQWFIEKLKESAKRLSQADNVFNTDEKRGSITHNELRVRITRSRTILLALGEDLAELDD